MNKKKSDYVCKPFPPSRPIWQITRVFPSQGKLQLAAKN